MKRGCLLIFALWIASWALLATTTAWGRLDQGGYMSRDLAVGVRHPVGEDPITTIYATTQENPGVNGEQMILWAFCVDAQCDGVPLGEIHNTPGVCEKPCKWRVDLPGSYDSDSFGPPSVSEDGSRVFVGSKNGKFYAYDYDGSNAWTGLPCPLDTGSAPKDHYDTLCYTGVEEDFYATPTVYEWNDGAGDRRLIFASDRGKNGKAHVHIITDLGFDEPGIPWSKDRHAALTNGIANDHAWVSGTSAWPCRIPGSSNRFQPIVDDALGKPHENDKTRIYVAAEAASKGMYALSLETSKCPDNSQNEEFIWQMQRSKKISLAFRLGGTILENVDLDPDPASETRGRLLVANATGGVVGICLDDHDPADNATEDPASPYVQSGICDPGDCLFVKRNNSGPGSGTEKTHRSRPTQSTNAREPRHVLGDPGVPVVYLSGQGSNLHRIDEYNWSIPSYPGDAKPYYPTPENGTAYQYCTLNTEPDEMPWQSFPVLIDTDPPIGEITSADDKDASTPRVSYSSPDPNPWTGHILYGAAHANDPIYRFDPACPQRSTNDDVRLWSYDQGGVPQPNAITHHHCIRGDVSQTYDYNDLGWFDYAPADGWRTNAVYTEKPRASAEPAKRRVHIGSARSILYAFDADEPCGVVEWCYDTEDGTDPGGSCAVTVGDPDGAPDCCTNLDDTAYLTTDAKRYRRRERSGDDTCASCWDANNDLIACDTMTLSCPASVSTVATSVSITATFTSAQAGENPVRGEWMNETTGEYGAFHYDGANCDANSAACCTGGCSVPVDPSDGESWNDIRVSLFDRNDNEITERCVVEEL